MGQELGCSISALAGAWPPLWPGKSTGVHSWDELVPAPGRGTRVLQPPVPPACSSEGIILSGAPGGPQAAPPEEGESNSSLNPILKTPKAKGSRVHNQVHVLDTYQSLMSCRFVPFRI